MHNESSFVRHNGNVYTQIKAFSMDGFLGLTFSKYYMPHVENKVFKNYHKPKIFVRYVVDIFILAKNKKRNRTFGKKNYFKIYFRPQHVHQKDPSLDVPGESSNIYRFTMKKRN